MSDITLPESLKFASENAMALLHTNGVDASPLNRATTVVESIEESTAAGRERIAKIVDSAIRDLTSIEADDEEPIEPHVHTCTPNLGWQLYDMALCYLPSILSLI